LIRHVATASAIATWRIKVLGTGDGIERFAREARLLASLRHPAIVELVAEGRDDGRSWIAMEWLDGEDLASRLRRGPLSVEETLVAGRRAAEALAVAHARGVVHRDVKPSNLFLVGGRPDELKVLDFGVAHVQRDEALTFAGDRVGTPRFMAPEQVRADGDIDARTDVFALGAVLYACLTGRPPFSGSTELAVFAKILLEDPPPIGDVPSALEALILRMMAKDRERRPATGAEVTTELAGVLGGAPPPPPSKISGNEQRVLAVVIARGRTLVDSSAATAADTGASLELSSMTDPLGGHTERLGDGSIIVTLAEGTPGDLARRAVKIAGAMSASGRRVAAALGRGVLAGRLPLG
jgi:serine/threonine protein kinase